MEHTRPIDKDEEYNRRREEAISLTNRIEGVEQELREAESELESSRQDLREESNYTATLAINRLYKETYQAKQRRSKENILNGVRNYTYPITERAPLEQEPEQESEETPTAPRFDPLPLNTGL